MDAIDIYCLPEVALSYKQPRVPMLPFCSWEHLAVHSTNRETVSRFLEKDSIFLSSGRIALYHALQLSNVGPGTEVLLPAYHCGSMIEPAVHLSARVKFYNMRDKLDYSLSHIEKLIGDATKAIVVPHFFGSYQDLSGLKELCEKRGLKLIEDCAHAFFYEQGGNKPGTTGDFAITSTVKFFPGTHGGALVVNDGTSPDFQALSSSLKQELKCAKNMLEHYFKYRRPVLPELGCGSEIPDETELTTLQTRTIRYGIYDWFDPAEIGLLNTHTNRTLIKHTNYREVVDKRRSNYLLYESMFKGMDNCHPFFDSLGSTVPYAFPLVLECPERYFARLKQARVPIWRWEELAVTDCAVSDRYRYTLLQLPCHQSIDPKTIHWIFNHFKETISR